MPSILKFMSLSLPVRFTASILNKSKEEILEANQGACFTHVLRNRRILFPEDATRTELDFLYKSFNSGRCRCILYQYP